MSEPTSIEPIPNETMGRRLRRLPRNVVALGVVSFVADLSSEMIYPIFPGFVTKTLGASAAVLGLIEGSAEATASLTRYPFGRLSDAAGRGVPSSFPATAWPPSASSCWPWPTPGRWRSADGWSIASARACAPRRATPCSRRTSATMTAAWRSACTAPWTPPAR